MSNFVTPFKVKKTNHFFQYDPKEAASTATAEFEPEVGDHGKLLKCLGENPRLVSSKVEDQKSINVHCKCFASFE